MKTTRFQNTIPLANEFSAFMRLLFRKGYINFCILGVSAVLTGCSIGPKYVPPSAVIPSHWIENEEKPIVEKDQAWWRNFHDPVLNNLIEQRSVYNLDLNIARQRMETARAEYAMAAAQLFPSADISGLPPSGTGAGINQLIALTTSIDPDFFGRLRQNKLRAKALVQVSEAEQQFALINLYAEIATAYLELRKEQARTAMLRQNLQGANLILQFSESKHKAGQVKFLDIAQQKSLIETQSAELEQNEASMIAILHKIELLTGNNPGRLAHQLLPMKPIPEMTQKVHLDIPSKVLRRRPDIIAAEQRVVAAHANIKVSIANLFPQLNIGWLLGWQTQTLASNLFAIQNPESTLYGTFNATIFNLASYRDIDVKKREKALAVLQYQIAVMSALHEVETQYNYAKHYGASQTHLARALEHKKLILKLFKQSYEKGLSDFSTVIRAEQELNYVQSSYLQNKVMHQVAKINLYKALGGNALPPG